MNLGNFYTSEWPRLYSRGFGSPGTTRISRSVCRYSADNSRSARIFCTVWHGLSFEKENRSCWNDRSIGLNKKIMKT